METYYEKAKKLIKPGVMYNLSSYITFIGIRLNRIEFEESDLYSFRDKDIDDFDLHSPSSEEGNWKKLLEKIIIPKQSLEEQYSKELAEVERLFPKGMSGKCCNGGSCARNGVIYIYDDKGHIKIHSGEGLLWSSKHGYSTPDSLPTKNLFEEAKEKYPIGTVFKDLVHHVEFTVRSHSFDNFGTESQLYIPVEKHNAFSNKTARIYSKGEWAEIISQDSLIEDPDFSVNDWVIGWHTNTHELKNRPWQIHTIRNEFLHPLSNPDSNTGKEDVRKLSLQEVLDWCDKEYPYGSEYEAASTKTICKVERKPNFTLSQIEAGKGYLYYKGEWAKKVETEPENQLPLVDVKTPLEICKEKYKEGMTVIDAITKNHVVVKGMFIESPFENIFCFGNVCLYQKVGNNYAGITSSPSDETSKPIVTQVICTRGTTAFKKGLRYGLDKRGVPIDDNGCVSTWSWNDPKRSENFNMSTFKMFDPTMENDAPEGPSMKMQIVLDKCIDLYPIGTIVSYNGDTRKVEIKPVIGIDDRIYSRDDQGSFILYDDNNFVSILAKPIGSDPWELESKHADPVISSGIRSLSGSVDSWTARMEREQMQAWKINQMRMSMTQSPYFPPLSTLRSPKQEDESNPFLLNKKSKKKLNENIQSPKSITLKIKK